LEGGGGRGGRRSGRGGGGAAITKKKKKKEETSLPETGRQSDKGRETGIVHLRRGKEEELKGVGKRKREDGKKKSPSMLKKRDQARKKKVHPYSLESRKDQGEERISRKKKDV